MILNAFTLFHVALSLIGIVTGLIVLFGFLALKASPAMTSWFLVTTVATDVTGFLFPFHGFLPSYAIGILSLIVLAVAIAARYRFHLAGGWRTAWVVTSMTALYFNVFVLVAQSFQKIPALKELAPTQSDPPFLIAEGTVLVLFVVLIVAAARKVQPQQ